MGRHRLGSLTQIPQGEGRNFAVAGQEVAVFRARDGAVYATQARCPHRAGPLADGLVGGSTLVCPLHDWQFDLASGKALRGDCDLSVYRVALGPDQELLLELPGE
jgi:nitrite reductase (NADH) small subunit